jgi:hypothetical protein
MKTAPGYIVLGGTTSSIAKLIRAWSLSLTTNVTVQMYLPFACTTISLPGVMLKVVFPCPGGIANGTANGPTPAIMSATTSGGSLGFAAVLACAAGGATSTQVSIAT